MFFNTQNFGPFIVTFLISFVILNVSYWIIFFTNDPPKVRGAIIVTLLRIMVICKGRVFFQVKWEDIKQVKLSKERVEGYEYSKVGYKLIFFDSQSSKILRLWSISISKKNTHLLINTIKNIATLKKFNFNTNYKIKEISMFEAGEITKEVRKFNAGKI